MTTSPAPTTTEAPAAPSRWQDTDLPEDLREATTFAKYENREQAFRALHAAQSLVGKHPSEVVAKPKLDDDGSVREFMKAAGLPDHIDAYKLDVPGADNDPLSQAFRTAAFEAGVPPKQMAGLYGKLGQYLRSVEDGEKAKQAELETANIAAIEAQHGAATPDVVKRADIVAEHFKLTEVLNAKDLGTDPAVINFLAQAYSLIAEDSVGGRKDIGSGAKSPADYLAEADRLTRESHAATDRGTRMALAERAVNARKLANLR